MDASKFSDVLVEVPCDDEPADYGPSFLCKDCDRESCYGCDNLYPSMRFDREDGLYDV